MTKEHHLVLTVCLLWSSTIRGLFALSDFKWTEALADFLLFKQAQGIAERTLKDYRCHVTRFFTLYPDVDSLRSNVLDYMARDVKPSTFNLRREYLGVFFRWCMEEGLITQYPLRGINKRKDDGSVRHLPEETLRQLVSLPDLKTYVGLRDHAMILLAMNTGIRPGEELALVPQDISIPNLCVIVRGTVAKTRRERILPIHPMVACAIKSLLAARHFEWGDNVPVFCTTTGGRLQVADWANRLKAYGGRLGTRITPYMLRHSFAIVTLRAGGNAFTIQSMLGHSSMEMTRRYVRLVESDLKEQMGRANPIDRILPAKKRVRRRL